MAANLCAALVSFDPGAALQLAASRKASQSDTYELAFNAACAAAEQGDWSAASVLLDAASDTAAAVLGEEEKAAELSIIRAQQGFVAQHMGLRDLAVKRYLEVTETKGSDKTAAAVAAANLVGLQEQHGLFDSLKRLERAKQSDVYDLLTEEQRESVSLNHAVVLLRLHKTNEARKALEECSKEFPKSGLPRVLLASLLPKDEALAVLEKAGNDEAAALARSKLLAERGDVEAALEALRKASGPWNSSRVSAAIALATQLGQASSVVADAILSEGVGRARTENDKLILLVATARLKAARGDHRAASEDWRLALRLRPDNKVLITGLVASLSHSDPAAADALAANLPTPKAVTDAETLEERMLAAVTTPVSVATPIKSSASSNNSGSSSNDNSGKDSSKASSEAVSSAPADQDVQRKRKRTKRNKKKRLPKDLDKPIDPERWLPMKQRSYYIAPIKKAQKGKKGRIGGAGGHQGGTVSAEVAASLDAAAKSKSSPPPAAQSKGNPRRKK